MGSFGGAIGNANFQEPSSPDPTSAPPIPDQQVQQTAQQPMQGQGQAQGLAQALARRKKKGLIGPRVRTPGPLAAAISASKRARQSGHKYG
jgi:hypothetical protein